MTLSAFCCRFACVAAVALAGWSGPAAAQDQTQNPNDDRQRVDIELMLLLDGSGSVDNEEWRLQMDAYCFAFQSRELHAAVERLGGVMVRAANFSTAGKISGTTHTRVLRTAKDCNDWAAHMRSRINQRARGGTAIGDALLWAMNDLGNNDFVSRRRIIDVSGDGPNDADEVLIGNRETHSSNGKRIDYGATMAEVAAAREGAVTINAISIGADFFTQDENPDYLREWYAKNMPMGVGSFTMHAEDFEAFEDAIKRKLIREISAPLDQISFD